MKNKILLTLFALSSFFCPIMAEDEVFDIVIVGLGNAGAPMAARLTQENPNLSVCVLESGRDDIRLGEEGQLLPEDLPGELPNKDNNPWATLPRSGPYLTYGHSQRVGFHSWQFQPLLRDPADVSGLTFPDGSPAETVYAWVPKGSTWGGTSVHNAGISIRGSKAVYDAWDAQLGSPGIWDYDSVLPYFKKLENRSQVDPNGNRYFDPGNTVGTRYNFTSDFHGDAGPVDLLVPTFEDALSAALKASAETSGRFRVATTGFKTDLDSSNEDEMAKPDVDNQHLSNVAISAQAQLYQQGPMGPIIGPDPYFFARNPYGDSDGGGSGPPANVAVFPSSYDVIGLGGTPPLVQRVSAQTAYIYGRNPAVQADPQRAAEIRPNLTIKSESLATRIIFNDDKRAVGVEYLQGWNIYQAGRNLNTADAGIGGTPTDAKKNGEKVRNEEGYRVIRARHEVILCGGVINSPQLLMLSGVGPKDDLEALDIPVVSDLPGVGQHWQDMHEIDLTWRITNNTWNAFGVFAAAGFMGKIPKFVAYTHRFKSDPNQLGADAQVHYLPGGISSSSSGVSDLLHGLNRQASLILTEDARNNLTPFDTLLSGKLTPFVGAARYDGGPAYIADQLDYFDPPLQLSECGSLILQNLTIPGQEHSEGYLKLVSKDPTCTPFIVTNAYGDGEDAGGVISGGSDDMQRLVNAFKYTVAPLVQGLPNDFFGGWIAPHPEEFITDAGLMNGDTMLLYPGNDTTQEPTNFDEDKFRTFVLKRIWGHQSSGTCKMGPADDDMAVVDERGRVYGVNRLRVCDCSIFREMPTANRQIPTYMIAERMSDLITEDLVAEVAEDTANAGSQSASTQNPYLHDPFIGCMIEVYGGQTGIDL